jgi:hypothetical protein
MTEKPYDLAHGRHTFPCAWWRHTKITEISVRRTSERGVPDGLWFNASSRDLEDPELSSGVNVCLDLDAVERMHDAMSAFLEKVRSDHRQLALEISSYPEQVARWLTAYAPDSVLIIETPFLALADDLVLPSNTCDANNLEVVREALSGLRHNWAVSDRDLLPCGHRPQSGKDVGFLDLVFREPKSAIEFFARCPNEFKYTSQRGDGDMHRVMVRGAARVKGLIEDYRVIRFKVDYYKDPMPTTPKKSTNQHTPGPWKAEPPVNGPGYFRQTWEVVPESEPSVTLASVNGLPDEEGVDFEGLDFGVIEADARLISSAPDLLEALEFIEFSMSHCVGTRAAEAVQRKARAAIAKAKG